jgi:hypothetical protein
MQGPPQPEQPCAAPLPQEPNEKRNALIKTNLGRFDSLVARYYPAVYNFASGLTDDPREAVLLTYRAFNSIRNQLWLHRDDIVLVRILLKGVVRAGVRGVAIESRTSLLAFLRGLSFPARAEFVNVHLSHLLAPRSTFCFRIDHPLYSL